MKHQKKQSFSYTLPLMTSFFSLSIFLGSLLLFQVQPMLGKYILPWFGGTSAVWITAMLFFQVLLLLGYIYVLLLGRLPVKAQVIVHGSFVVLIGAVLFLLFSVWPSPIMPEISWKLSDNWSPILQVLAFLGVSVGLPYFLLSTTSILLQKWFSHIKFGQSPYLFYALSNAASLIGVMSYPFVVEPFLPLQQQGIWWTIGFLCYVVCLALSCGIAYRLLQRHRAAQPHEQEVQKIQGVTGKLVLFWLLLSGTSSLMLLSITNLMTQSVAPIPFLWLLPLSLYLLSFILAFSGRRWYKRNFFAYLFLLFAPVGIIFSLTSIPTVYIGIFVYTVILFSICMICHGELYAYKPHPTYLDRFYVVIALGGALGSLLVGIIAPLFFKGIWEVLLGFYVSILLSLFVLLQHKRSLLFALSKRFFVSPKETYIAAALLMPFVIGGLLLVMYKTSGFMYLKDLRSFYGLLQIREKIIDGVPTRQLIHGNIIHGSQFMSDALRRTPTLYFTPESGIGMVLKAISSKEKPVHVGVLGLGVGTLATYSRAGDHYRFYEINPQVIDLAWEDFSYLKDAPAKISVIEGDGRLSLERELQRQDPEKFDVLIMDAFSDDSVPFHLLTREAMSIYLARLKPEGVLAFNISNRYLDLRPPLCRLAKEFDLTCVFVSNDEGKYAVASHWIIMTNNSTLLKEPALAKAAKNQNHKESIIWTDSYSNLLQVIK